MPFQILNYNFETILSVYMLLSTQSQMAPLLMKYLPVGAQRTRSYAREE